MRRNPRKRVNKKRVVVFIFLCGIFVIGVVSGKSSNGAYVNKANSKKDNAENICIENENKDVNEERIPSEYVIDIEGISQEGIPTGCEIVSAVTVLNYYGVQIAPEEFIEMFLDKEPFYYSDGILYGPNPSEKFAGDPYDSSSLGCFPPVIVNSIMRMKEYDYEEMKYIDATILEENSLEKLCAEYVANDMPVLVWATINMRKPKEGTSYILEEGTTYTWIAGEHCMVLCGYDEENYYFIDPLSDGDIVTYGKDLAQLRYEQMGNCALLIKMTN